MLVKKAYVLRHQAKGVLTDRIYLSPPNAEEMATVLKRCERNHGTVHPKTGERYWLVVQETCLLGDDSLGLKVVGELEGGELPAESPDDGIDRDQDRTASAALSSATLHGVGEVKNP